MTKLMYVQLMDSILHKIVTGEYKIGQKIISEREMSDRYGLNRMTVRKAIKKLTEEGYLISVQGKGTYVNSIPSKDKRIELGGDSDVSLSASLRQSGFKSSRIVLSLDCVENDDFIEQFPNSKEIYRLVRLSKIDEKPYVLQICVFPKNLFKNPERFDFGEGSLYDFMEEYGHKPILLKTDLQVIDIPDPYVEIMNTKKKKKIFYVEYFGYDMNRDLVEYTKSYYMSEYTTFRYMTHKKQ
ncbi:MAG: GntR family transcriptional regulator [Anaerorhabdus sp.]|uniref:GntR family transcriptional regulator n=1 Tax=Anaerorhabdus sp. TaxID=1872524 RepID=UPI002B21F62F|nr:GntR family transcriptional regulator [Anaerorhabdus sp.]MEA4874016.1 GntR family transcriptional regulator [Anaerorhabdus sp.]